MGKEEKMNLQSCKTQLALSFPCLVDWLMERQRENMRTVKAVILKEHAETHTGKKKDHGLKINKRLFKHRDKDDGNCC